MAKFGLGKGLTELETEMGQSPEIQTLAGMPERVLVRPVPINQIGANPDQPRKTFSAGDLEDLAQSIREHGVLQPIIVRAVSGMPYVYEIVAGERRWRACQLLKKETIPALVKPLSPENAMEIALIENVQRENLNAIEECDAYAAIMEKCGYTLDALSRLIGKSESYIRNIMRLGNLPKSVKDLVIAGEISASHARTLATAENAEELAKKIIDNNLNVHETAQIVKEGPRAGTAKRKARKNIGGIAAEEIRKIERAIEDATGLEAKIAVKASGAGKITLSFASLAELELLTETLRAAPVGEN